MDGRVVLVNGEAAPLAHHKAKVLAIAFSNKKNCLIYSVKNNIYILYLKKKTAEAAKPVKALAFEEGNFIRALTVIENRNSEDSFLIAGDAKGNVFHRDLSGDVGEKKRLNTSFRSSDSAFHAIAYHSMKNLLVLANAKGKLFLLPGIHSNTLKSNRKITSFSFERQHKGIVRALAFGPGGHYLASGGLDRTLMLWDLDAKDAEIARQDPILIIQSKQKILAIGFDRLEQYLVFSDEKHLRLCPTNPDSLFRRLSIGKRRGLTQREVLQYISEDVKQKK
jgi:WD40 repeat protein